MRDLLPANSTSLEMALADIAWQAINVDFPLRDLHDPDKCPEPVLPFLAWQYSVDFWDDEWSINLKRQVVKSAITIHQHKGTIGALKDALNAIDMDININEWFEYGGEPYKFNADVNLSNRSINMGQIKTIAATIKMAKNTRSHLDKLRVFQVIKTKIPQLAISCLMGQIVTVFPQKPKNQIISNRLPFISMAVQYIQKIIINPKVIN